MRRTDRQVNDPVKIREIIEACHCCRLGFNDNGKVYIVPLNFGYEVTENKNYLYFHGALQGRKVELIKREGQAGFEMDTGYKLNAAKEACGYAAAFQSIIGAGNVCMLEETEEKIHALRCIMSHNTGKSDWEFPLEAVKKTAVFRLEITELSCKEHK